MVFLLNGCAGLDGLDFNAGNGYNPGSKNHTGAASNKTKRRPLFAGSKKVGSKDENTEDLKKFFKNDPFTSYYQKAFDRPYGDRFGGKATGRPGGLCARYVDTFLVSMGCMKSRVHANAKDMPPGLRARGFKDIGSLDICDARIGDVIVYSGSYGHIEIKTPRGYLSDYLVDIPRPYGIPDSAVTNRREFAMGQGSPSRTHCGNGAGTSRPVKAILRPPAGCI
ncbi:MAG: hypothetical protein R3A80_09305 [Bdellovibrionota bacterium]